MNQCPQCYRVLTVRFGSFVMESGQLPKSSQQTEQSLLALT